MTDFASLIAGIGLAAIGGYIVFAPPPVRRLDEPLRWVLRGGGLVHLLGHGAIVIGGVMIVTWVLDNLWRTPAN